MLISKSSKIKSSKFYKDLGYDISDSYIDVDISDIPLGSRCLVEVSCDYCPNTRTISYKDYNRNISINGKYSCSIKCGRLKSKETNILKYGVDSTNKLDTVKKKSKKTLLDKYGVDHISKVRSISESKSEKMKLIKDDISDRMVNYWSNISDSDKVDINKKREKTVNNLYGVNNISQCDDIKNKKRETFNIKYGGFTLESKELSDKVIKTNLDKYGYKYPIQSNNIKEKMWVTNLERWGTKYPSQNDDIKLKTKNTNLKNWGVENPMMLDTFTNVLKEKFISKYEVDSYFKTQEFIDSNKGNLLSSDDWRKENLIISKDINYLEYIGNNISTFRCDNDKDHIFTISSVNYHNRIKSKCKLCTICYPISSGSNKQTELFEFIKGIYNGNVIKNWKGYKYELDVYIPDINIGFEFNGLYWHSESKLGRNYHLNKLNLFKKNNIQVFNIWEDDWDNKKDIIKSQIKNRISNNNNKIFARKCKVRELDCVKDFLNNNHIQGFIGSSVKIGLFNNNELVSVMIFDNIEGRKKMLDGSWNLSRFCNLLNTNVVGGASKLLSYFIKNYNVKRIISYADMDWSDGALYYKLGFNLISQLKPDYKYIIDGKRINKRAFSKNKLSKIEGVDISLSESIITNKLNIERIFNCGKLKFQLLV